MIVEFAQTFADGLATDVLNKLSLGDLEVRLGRRVRRGVQNDKECSVSIAHLALNPPTLSIIIQAALYNLKGPKRINEILTCLLLTLLEIEKGPCRADVETAFQIDLSDLPVNVETASEVCCTLMLPWLWSTFPELLRCS